MPRATSTIWPIDEGGAVSTTGGGPILVVVGAPGAGKTTVGTLVAARLGVEFRDTDADIVAAQGRSVADIFIESGEEQFHTLERAAVAAALLSHSGVLALGGGAVLDAGTRALLAHHRVCWLRVGLSDAASRVGLSGARPLLVGNVRGTLLALLDARTPLYAEVASFDVVTDARTPEAVADEVMEHLRADGVAL